MVLIVSKITSNKLPCADRTLALPARGVVLVTGPNACGKSLFMTETVAWGVWGETLSREPLAIPGARVQIVANGLTIERKRGQRQDMVRFAGADGVWSTYDTATKATAALEAVLGSFAAWRRSSVLTSDDAAAFGSATESQRRAMLELALGFDGYIDAAWQAAKHEIKQIDRSDAALRTKLAATEAAIAEVGAHLAVVGGVDMQGPEHGAMEDAEGRYRSLLAASRAIDDEVVAASALVSERSRAQTRVTDDKRCVACGSAIDSSVLQTQAALVAEAHALALAAQAKAHERKATLRAEMNSVSAEIDRLRAARIEHRAAVERAAMAASANARLAVLNAELSSAQHAAAASAERLSTMAAVVDGLSPGGVRATLFSQALDSLEGLANAYMSWLHPDLCVRISASKQTKAGPVDSIALSVQTNGAPAVAYRACSAGTRRRVDISVLLALRSLVGAGGTLYCDEVFDRLDVQGVQGAAALIRDLGTSQCVVVITHNKDLARLVVPDVNLVMG